MKIRILERTNLYQIAEWCGGGVQTVDVEDLTYTGRVVVTNPESVKVPTAAGSVYATPRSGCGKDWQRVRCVFGEHYVRLA